MTTTELSTQLDAVLRPLGIVRSMKSYRILCDCIFRICEQEYRLEAVQKEVYTPVAQQHCCHWSSVQSALRRASKAAWEINPDYVRKLAGYPLSGCPSAVQLLEMIYNAVVRG